MQLNGGEVSIRVLARSPTVWLTQPPAKLSSPPTSRHAFLKEPIFELLLCLHRQPEPILLSNLGEALSLVESELEASMLVSRALLGPHSQSQSRTNSAKACEIDIWLQHLEKQCQKNYNFSS